MFFFFTLIMLFSVRYELKAVYFPSSLPKFIIHFYPLDFYFWLTITNFLANMNEIFIQPMSIE